MGIPGVGRGPCPITSGKPSDVRSKYPDAAVKYMNVKYGSIGSTINGKPAPTPAPTPTPTTRGQCCYGAAGAGCSSMGSCQGGWCGRSQVNCEQNCNGKWCPKDLGQILTFV